MLTALNTLLKEPILTAKFAKVSPDEDSEEQVTSICAAVWAARVDGVVVGKSAVESHVLYFSDA